MKRLLQPFLVVVFTGLLISGAAGPLLAQGLTAAALSGTVTDAGGTTLPGVNVVAVHEPTGTPYGTTTNLDGQYTLFNLRVGGPYTVQVSFVGFGTTRETGLNLSLGQTRTLDFVLQEATVELGEVQVTGTANTVLNSERTGASTNVDEETIESLPTIARSLADFSRLTPQASGGNSLLGRSNRYNNIQIDGATLNDVFGLASGTGAPGGAVGAQPISLDAIQEFNVDIAPYDIRYSGFTGGSINAITRSGTNRYEGSVYYLGRNETFVGDLEDATGQAQSFPTFNEYFLGGRLGGPLVKNRLFFFVNAELRRRDDPLSVGIAGSGAANVFDVDAATFNRIVDIVRTRYGYDPGSYDPLTRKEDDNKVLAKLDWNIDNRHRLTLRHNYVEASQDDGVERSGSQFFLSSSMYVGRSVQHSSVAELKSTLGSRLFNQARLVYTRIRDSRDLSGGGLFPQVTIDVEDKQILFGSERFSHANELDQDLYEFTNDLTYITGAHSLTLGTSNQITRFRNMFLQDLYGQYEFDSIEDFEAGRPSLYRLSYSTLPGVDRPAPEFSGVQIGLYAQDQWAAAPGLQLTFGVRVDVPFFPDDPLANPLVPTAYPGYTTTNTASGNVLFSPRFGFNWDASGGERSTQLRGGTGIFSGRTPFVWISNQYGNTGMDLARAEARGSAAPDFSPDPLDQPRLPGLTSEINLIDDSFTFPQVWRTNLALDQQLPLGLIGTLEALYTKSLNEVVYTNLNLGQTGTAFDGRPLYGTYDDRNRSLPNRLSSSFTNAILLTNTSEGYAYSLTAQVQKQAVRGLEGMLAYTLNRAENVNNLTSSRAISNWQNNENFDVNRPELGTADFEVRHRVLSHLSYRLRYGGRFSSIVSLVYEGRSGAPFSWIYFGDANAEGNRFNDLVYVPERQDEIILVPGSGDTRTPDQIWAQLDAFIESEPSLREARGEVAKRNAARLPWRNNLDLRFIQEIETLGGQRLELTANLFNVLNLLNPDWGRVYFLEFDNINLMTFNGYDAATGKPRIGFNEVEDRKDLFLTSDLASRWQVQLGVRYTF